MIQAENRQMWESRVAKFKASNQSATEWCAAHDLKTHQLYYWIRKLKTSSHSKALPTRVGKATIEVSSGFDPALLSDVVRTLAVL